MRIVNIQETKTHLSKLVELAAKGELFIITKAGHPMVKVVPLEQAENRELKKLGFFKDSLHVPDELVDAESEAVSGLFKEINDLFNGSSL
jgi:prevent-host-death family protein